jgi:hypothetical protein
LLILHEEVAVIRGPAITVQDDGNAANQHRPDADRIRVLPERGDRGILPLTEVVKHCQHDLHDRGGRQAV